MVAHHPPAEYLTDYAAGAACEAVSVLIATHLALCPQCRDHVGALEVLGGAMLEDMAPEELASLAPPDISRADLEPSMPDMGVEPPSGVWPVDPMIPNPLRQYLRHASARPHWQWRMPGISKMSLGNLRVPENGSAHLMRIPASRAMPHHTHRGDELTLVLSGGFSDESGHFGRGDLGYADGSTHHRPVADKGEPCICFVVTRAPLRLTGWTGSLVNWALER
jgi:putative transcriptional regulator